MSDTSESRTGQVNLPAERGSSLDRVIATYRKDVDRTLLRENLELTVDQRFEKFERFMEQVFELRRAGQQARQVG
jgi:hypothetical protein